MNLNYSISNGLQIAGVDTKSPIILDNDQVKDSPEIFFLWLKSNRKELNVVGNIATKDGHPTGRPLTGTNSTFNEWNEVYAAFEQGGLKNVPRPILGATRNFNPSSIENSAGADLIIWEAKKCSPERPLVIIVGGQCSTVANAFAKDKTIGPNLLIMHVDGKGQTQYNDIDSGSSKILLDNGVSYINWSGDQYGWYTGAGYRGSVNPPINRMPGVTFVDINNPFARMYKSAFEHMFNAYGSLGDATPALYMVNHSLWQNVIRKTKTNQTVTGAYDYLLVSQNNWTQYGPTLSSFMNNPQSYVPVTVEPPVNNAPTISILTPSTTYSPGSSIIITATASDDKAVSKVEFFNGSIKLGESLTSPYSWVINNATAGTYNLTGKATDNEGASTVSSVRVVTVSGVVIPPIPPLPAGPKEFRMSDFTKGEGGDDTVQFQKAIDMAIAAYGHLIIDPPSKQYRVRNLRINPLQGRKQVWFKLTQFGWTPEGDNPIKYIGDSNKAVFYTTGLKNTIIEGLNVGILDQNHVSIMDLDGDNDAPSIGFSTFINNHYNLGKGQYNVGTRIGHKIGMFPQSNGDISNVLWENCATFGGGASEQSIAGQIAYLHEGRNSLHFNWLGGFGAWLQNVYSNQSGPEAQFDRGNGACFFDGFGTSQNDTNYVVAFQSQYVFDGGRHESSKKFLKVVAGGNSNISIRNAEINDFKTTDGSIIDLNTACTLVLDNVAALRSGTSNFDKMINCNSNGDFGSVDIQSGSFQSTEPLVKKTGGTTQWRVYTRAATRLGKDRGGVFTNGFIPDVNGQIL